MYTVYLHAYQVEKHLNPFPVEILAWTFKFVMITLEFNMILQTIW